MANIMTDQENAESSQIPTGAELREKHPNARRLFLDPSSPSPRSIVRVVMIALLLLLAVGLIGVILFSLTYLLFLVILAVFFAYLLDPLVKLIRRPFKMYKIERFMPRGLAIAISYLIWFLVLGIGISVIAPKVA